jgi:hypothetical protein
MFAGAFTGLLKAANREAVSLGECFRSGFENFLPVLALAILWYIGIVIGTVLFIIPGLILLTMWSVALPVLVSEDVNVIASFGRSRQLTRGSRLKIMLVLVLFAIVIYGLTFGLIMSAFGVGFTELGIITGKPSYLLASIPNGWIGSFLLVALLASIYLETLLVKEGGRSSELLQVFD